MQAQSFYNEMTEVARVIPFDLCAWHTIAILHKIARQNDHLSR